MIRASTNEELKTLLLLGPCYKEDYIRVINSNRPTYIYDKLLENEYIEEKEITKQNIYTNSRAKTKIVKVSNKGKRYLADTYNDNFYIKQNDKEQIFNSNNSNLTTYIWPQLTKQKTKAMFYAAGANVFAKDKPSFGYLYNTLTKDASIIKNKYPYNADYLDSELDLLSSSEKRKKCSDLLQNGIYYTSDEYTDFLKECIDKHHADTFRGLKWAGLYVNDRSCFVTFVSSYGNNTRIFNMYQKIKNLIDELNYVIGNMTNVFEYIKFNDEHYKLNDLRQNKIDAIVFSLGDSLVYSSALSAKYGKTARSTAYMHESAQKKAKEKKNSTKYDIMDYTSQIFSRIFIIPTSNPGIIDLQYLINTSINDWHSDQLTIFNSCKRAKVNENSHKQLFPATLRIDYSTVPSIVLKVHEVKLYKYLSDRVLKFNEPVNIVTDSDKFNAIAHSLCKISNISNKEENFKPGFYLTRLDNNKISTTVDHNNNLYFLYDERGEISGLTILNHYLIKQNKKYIKEKNVYQIVNKDEDIHSLMNSIATFQISPEEVYNSYKKNINKLLVDIKDSSDKSVIKNGKNAYHRTNQVTTRISDEILDDIRSYCNKNQITISKFAADALQEHYKNVKNN